MTRLEEIKKKLNLPCTAQSSTVEFVDAAPFVAAFARGERVHKIADWTGQSKAAASSTSPTLATMAGINEEDWTLSLADATLSGNLASSMNNPIGRRTVRGVMPPKGIASSTGTGSLKPRTQKVILELFFQKYNFISNLFFFSFNRALMLLVLNNLVGVNVVIMIIVNVLVNLPSELKLLGCFEKKSNLLA